MKRLKLQFIVLIVICLLSQFFLPCCGAQNKSKKELAESYVKKAKILLNKKDYNKAIEKLNKAIKLDPENSKAYNNRGRAWYHKK